MNSLCVFFLNYPTQLLKSPTPKSEYLNNPDCYHCSCWCPQARLWAVHVYILQFLLIYNITFTNFAFFSFPEFQQSAFCAVQEYQSCNTFLRPAVSQRGLTSTWSSCTSIPLPWRPCGQGPVQRHPWKSSGSGTRQHLQASHLWDWGVLSVLSLLFSFFFNDWVTIFSIQVGSGHVHNSCLRETPSVLLKYMLLSVRRDWQRTFTTKNL